MDRKCPVCGYIMSTESDGRVTMNICRNRGCSIHNAAGLIGIPVDYITEADRLAAALDALDKEAKT